MQLMQHPPDSRHWIRRVEPGAVVVADQRLTASFLVGADALVENWPVRAVSEIGDAAIDAILALAPEVVLLGTGAKLTFPAQRVLGAFLSRRIGLESMDNAAAARTFNVLVEEGRKAVAAFIL